MSSQPWSCRVTAPPRAGARPPSTGCFRTLRSTISSSGRTKRNLARAVVHSSIDLPSSDLVLVDGIRATSPIRTVIEAAGDVRLDIVNDFVDDAVARALVRPAALERRARELVAPARPGAARVLNALASSHPELERARNIWEARLLRACGEAGLPDPRPNFPVTVGGRLRIFDLAWELARVCAEFDGYLPHLRTRRVFDDDRVRQNDLLDAGWLVVPRDLDDVGASAATDLAPIAARRSPSVLCPTADGPVRQLWDTAAQLVRFARVRCG